jgi:hypothetical protein
VPGAKSAATPWSPPPSSTAWCTTPLWSRSETRATGSRIAALQHPSPPIERRLKVDLRRTAARRRRLASRAYGSLYEKPPELQAAAFQPALWRTFRFPQPVPFGFLLTPSADAGLGAGGAGTSVSPEGPFGSATTPHGVNMGAKRAGVPERARQALDAQRHRAARDPARSRRGQPAARPGRTPRHPRRRQLAMHESAAETGAAEGGTSRARAR